MDEDDKLTPPKRIMPKKIIERYDQLPEGWQDIYMDLAQDGKSLETMFTSVGLTRRKHETLYRSNEDYKEWVNYCHDVYKGWWIDKSTELIKSKNSNGSIYGLVMRNTLGWTNNDVKQVPEIPPDNTEPVKSLEDFRNTASN